MEELSHLLLVSRGALLCLVEKEKSLLLSQLAKEELSQFSNLKYKRSIASTKDNHFQILLSALHMVVESSQKFLTEEHGIQNIWIPLLFLATDQET